LCDLRLVSGGVEMKKTWFVVAAAIPLVVVGSVAVWQLSGGDTRRIGALGPLEEPLTVAWRGTWSADLKYQPGQLVSHDGAVYIAEAESGGVAPDPTCEKDCTWTLLGSGAGTAGGQGPQGPPGPKGDPGAAGPKGDAGPGPITGRQVISKQEQICIRQTTQPGNPLPICLEFAPGPEATVNCPAGKVAVGGGGGERSEPRGTNGWWAKNPGTTPVTVYVVCVDS
jgi:hypothetical protein